ncbi:Muniscin C-terminal mu homology domain-containing protein [Microdochium trichocladiopsis]|uniref:Muniscin C-terminal mu homology domain-containing protein n=1 Tax=Microdochium trichocladiopsis TaxID=1682393 RepID=A0A9P8Y800_9PEZI|nr:Muniscin C-terminal mu homology domain-containing protein [Microdochium trichocladiopsis]KAH7031617.1 Muniscin C-terminal mu homology domain-containing protein [Microdochium trichocladiopsis]
MDDLSRTEYPAMLANLQPGQAVNALNDRVKRIAKVNTEIADWLQERRKVDEQYAQSLRKLTQFRVPNAQSELGTFQPQWDKILAATDSLASSHSAFAAKIDKDVETPLRNFQQKKEMASMQTIQGNLTNMAKELEDAQHASDKLSKKGGKASAAKMDMAAAKLESATGQWESQAPFIFETLQALDESRMNHLRDALTQYGTFEGERAQRHQADAELILNSLLDYSTATEISHFASRTTAGKPKLEKRATSLRQNSTAGTTTSTTAPSTTAPNNSLAPSTTTPSIAPPAPTPPAASMEDDRSEHSIPREAPPENKLRSRIGTMLGRRRQSIHGGFGQLSPSKGPFGRASKSSHGPSVSPRTSSNNLGGSDRLGSLAESEDQDELRQSEARDKSSRPTTNGTGAGETGPGPQTNGKPAPADLLDVPPPAGPPPSQRQPEKDAEGFTVPAAANDPISAAEKEAAGEEADQLFKLNIQNEPVADEDPEAKKAALSNVANSLAMGMPTRKTGTIRGRRDVRNTIYVPAPISQGSSTSVPFPPSPNFTTQNSRSTGLTALTSEPSVAGTSDTQSIRSATSLGGIIHAKHPDLHEPGLNSSIIETVSASFEDGQVKSVKVNGEIAFAYNASDSSVPMQIPIRINNFSALEVIGPNRIFVTNDTPDQAERFILDPSHLQKTSIGFSYRLHVDMETPATEHVPIILNPVWKPQGDKLGLLLQYKLNPTFKFAIGASSVLIHNLVFFTTYEGVATGAQTKPPGTHLKDKHLVYWRLGDVTLTAGGEWQKIVCRIIGAPGQEPKPGSVEARWEVSPGTISGGEPSIISVSRLEESKGKEAEVIDEDDPFADVQSEGKWLDIPATRKVVSGKYEGTQTAS